MTWIQGHGFLSLARNLFEKYGKKLLYTATKTVLDAEKKLPRS